jgi:hypothetical protein
MTEGPERLRTAQRHAGRARRAAEDRAAVSRFYTYFGALIGLVCAYFIVRLVLFTDLTTRRVPSDILQGMLIGFGLALVTAMIYGSLRATRSNGWTTLHGCGRPGNGMFFRAAQAWTFPGPIAVPEEAMYWWTTSDGSGRALNGQRDHVMHFGAGRLPPTTAFWSLTMSDGRNRYVPNPLNRYHVGDRSGLVANDDGSLDVYIQREAPVGHESNWLPAPAGGFILWLRVYIPGHEIVDGTYQIPPIEVSRARGR